MSLAYAKTNISKQWEQDKSFNNGIWTPGTLTKKLITSLLHTIHRNKFYVH